MSNFIQPKYRATDANGEPIPGAKLYFYTTGTTTPLATYSDEGFATPNANPVVADGNGYFGRIYLQDSAYRVKLTDADDVQIYSEDVVRGGALDSSDLATRVEQMATNPLDYGAVGDGAADEFDEVQAAIDASTGVVDLLGKTYKCNTGLTLKSNLTLRNGKLVFADCGDNYALRILGTSTSRGALASNATVGDALVTMASTSGFAIGDLIVLSKSAAWSAGLGDSGEMLRVSLVNTPYVSVSSLIRDTYNTANSATVTEVAPVSRVTLENVEIVGNESSTGDLVLLDAKFAESLALYNCKFTGIKKAAIKLDSCFGVHVSACLFVQGANTANAIDVRGASQDVAIGPSCVFSDIDGNGVRVGENAATNDWVSRNVFVSWCSFTGIGSLGVFVDKMSQHVRISGCTFDAVGGGDGVKVDTADDVTASGCLFECSDYGIILANTPTNFSQFGNMFDCYGGAMSGGTSDGATLTGSESGSGIRGVGGSSDGAGVYGVGGPTNGIGVHGQGTGTGYGVYGTTSTSVGVFGQATGASGVGVWAASDEGHALAVYGKQSSPTVSALHIDPQDTPTVAVVGDMYVNAAGKLYICTVAGDSAPTAPTWTIVGTQS